LLKIQ